VVVPHVNAAEAALVTDCEVIAARHIREVCAHFGGASRLGRYRAEALSFIPTALADLCDVRG
jgi:predicted ATPase with chaperone activity